MQGGEQAVYFVCGVVVHEADAQDAAVLLDAKALGKIQGVEIAIPDEDAAVAEERGDFCWMVVSQPEREC